MDGSSCSQFALDRRWTTTAGVVRRVRFGPSYRNAHLDAVLVSDRTRIRFRIATCFRIAIRFVCLSVNPVGKDKIEKSNVFGCVSKTKYNDS